MTSPAVVRNLVRFVEELAREHQKRPFSPDKLELKITYKLVQLGLVQTPRPIARRFGS